jgi:hypothetical protein
MTDSQTPIRKHAQRIRQLAEERQQVLSLPADKAMAAILDHPQPAALVHSFPEEDLFFLIHDIGPDDALPLLSLASNRQWEYLLDMQGWNRDQLDYPAVTTWLQLLLRADPERLVKWCFEEKLEFLELYLFRNIELLVRETDQTPSDFGDGYITDDDTYFVRLVDYPTTTPEEEAFKARRDAMLNQLLNRLSLFDHPRYQGLLMETIHVIPAETEEELFRLRNGRLGEKGFLPFHEAIGVYQPLRPKELAARGKKAIRTASTGDFHLSTPQLAATFLDEDILFVRALKGIHELPVIEQLQAELAGLCNQVISADQEVIVSRRQLQSVVSKISGYLSIGLEVLTEKGPINREAEASALLQDHLLVDIFRIGFAGALQLHWDAVHWRKTSWCQSQQVALTFWDETWLGLLGGLLIDRPKYYDPSMAETNYRDFRTRKEIEITRGRLDQLMALDQVLKEMQASVRALAHARFLTYKSLLLTLWSRAWLKLPPLDQATTTIAVPLADFQRFYTALWTVQDDRRLIDDAKRNEFLQWIAKASGQSPDHLSDRLGAVFEDLFNEIERELGPVKRGNLDPRYVQLFLLKH